MTLSAAHSRFPSGSTSGIPLGRGPFAPRPVVGFTFRRRARPTFGLLVALAGVFVLVSPSQAANDASTAAPGSLSAVQPAAGTLARWLGRGLRSRSRTLRLVSSAGSLALGHLSKGTRVGLRKSLGERYQDAVMATWSWNKWSLDLAKVERRLAHQGPAAVDALLVTVDRERSWQRKRTAVALLASLERGQGARALLALLDGDLQPGAMAPLVPAIVDALLLPHPVEQPLPHHHQLLMRRYGQDYRAVLEAFALVARNLDDLEAIQGQVAHYGIAALPALELAYATTALDPPARFNRPMDAPADRRRRAIVEAVGRIDHPAARRFLRQRVEAVLSDTDKDARLAPPAVVAVASMAGTGSEAHGTMYSVLDWAARDPLRATRTPGFLSTVTEGLAKLANRGHEASANSLFTLLERPKPWNGRPLFEAFVGQPNSEKLRFVAQHPRRLSLIFSLLRGAEFQGNLFLVLNHLCPLSCWFCINQDMSTRAPSAQIPLDVARQIVDEAAGLPHLGLTGGEPFLYQRDYHAGGPSDACVDFINRAAVDIGSVEVNSSLSTLPLESRRLYGLLDRLADNVKIVPSLSSEHIQQVDAYRHRMDKNSDSGVQPALVGLIEDYVRYHGRLSTRYEMRQTERSRKGRSRELFELLAAYGLEERFGNQRALLDDLAIHSIMGQGAASGGCNTNRARVVTLDEQDALNHNELSDCSPVVRALDGKIVTNFHSAYAVDPPESTILGNVYQGDGLFEPILRWAHGRTQVPDASVYEGLGAFLGQVRDATEP